MSPPQQKRWKVIGVWSSVSWVCHGIARRYCIPSAASITTSAWSRSTAFLGEIISTSVTFQRATVSVPMVLFSSVLFSNSHIPRLLSLNTSLPRFLSIDTSLRPFSLICMAFWWHPKQSNSFDSSMNSSCFTPISAPSTHACVVDYYSIDSSPLHHMISYSN